MIAKITIYDGDREILKDERKVIEVRRFAEDGEFLDCFVQGRFTIAEDEIKRISGGGIYDVQ